MEVLQREEEKLSSLVDKEKKQIEAMEEILAVLDNLEQQHNTGHLDHELAVRAFTKLKEEFPKEFHEFELSYCAQTVVIPLVKRSLGSWTNPLAGRNESLPHLTTFTQWREILDQGDGGYTGAGADTPMPAYHSLVWECWVPHVRLAVQRWHSRWVQCCVVRYCVLCTVYYTGTAGSRAPWSPSWSCGGHCCPPGCWPTCWRGSCCRGCRSVTRDT